jgi:hypothetical protein
MADYLLIESRDPFESNDVGYYCDLARGLVEAGNQVTLFLVQNAVLAARPLARSLALILHFRDRFGTLREWVRLLRKWRALGVY